MTTNKSQDELAALDHLFIEGELPEDVDITKLDALLEQSGEARARFDALAVSTRALEQSDSTTRSSFERAYGEASFLSALDAMLEDEAKTTSGPPEQTAEVIPLFTRITRAAPFIAAAAALLLAFVAVMDTPSDPTIAPPDEFQPRTAKEPGTRNHSVAPAPSLALFCAVRGPDGEVRFSGEEESPFGVLACPKDGELKLAHRAPDSAFTHVAVFGVDRSGAIKWYGPSPAARDAVAISTTRVGEGLHPVGESIRLGINHEVGKVRVHALFSNEPLGYGRMESLLEGRRATALFDDATLDLSDAGIATTSKTFDVTEGAR